LREAIRLQPDYAMAHHNLGQALARQGKLEEAIAAYREAIRLEPDYADSHFNLGIALRIQGKPEEAIAEYREAIRLEPDYVKPHLNLGYALGKQGKSEEAIAEYREAIRLQPDYALAHYNLGRVLHDQGKLEEAIACWHHLLEIAPTDSRTLHGVLASSWTLAGALTQLAWELATAEDVKLRSPKEAVEFGRRAVELGPKEANYWNNLGVAQYRAGDWQAAVDTFRKADALIGGRGDRAHRFFLAMAYWQLGRQAEAREAYAQGLEWLDEYEHNEEFYRFRDEAKKLLWERLEIAKKAVESSPEDPKLRYQLGVRLAEIGQHTEALAELDEAIRLDPTQAAYYAERARAHVELEDPDRAIEDANRAIELDPQLGLAYGVRATVYGQRDENEKAELDWAEAVRLAPEDAEFRLEQGCCYARVGKAKEAADSLTEAIRLDPDNDDAYVERGFARAALGDQTNAVADWRQAKRLDPTCAARIDFRLLGLSLAPTVADGDSVGPSDHRQAFPWIAEAGRPAPTASFVAPDQSHGMTPANQGDGRFVTQELDGTAVLVAEKSYLYFRIDDELMSDLSGDMPVLVRVTLLDTKRQGLDIEYDGHDMGANIESEGRYLETNKHSMTGSGGLWHYDFVLRHPRFSNRQNHGSDFRLRGAGDKQLAVHRVEILANDPRVEEYYAEVMRRFAELEQSPERPKDDTKTEKQE
jgi:tetratricopeptide (TPR) repeat protein